jgi:DUF971 family protein
MPTDPTISPTGVRAPHGATDLEMTWADGQVHRYPHRILRGFCPCAACQGHSGLIRVLEPPSLELRNLGQVGNYALALTWGDGHDAGIYSFRYLRRLGDLLEAHGADGLEALGELPRT